ncbi:hypothetical protein PRK78_004226 [Emydomyces testavorans]|uniref:C2H2-type domain-containing protein n=1 Tax=Emydomyces testavorans TaxID=2070801 RepID=A0AAF0DI94_9EURO|nr:hypothetical protein PRK78_004226 [Emydomyces testavorans]
MDDVYDSDDARAHTPPLEQSRVDYRPYESPPPPFLPDKSESPKGKESPSGCLRKGSRRRRKRPRTSIGIALILGSLAPDRPDLVEQLKDPPLPSDSLSETSEIDDEDRLRELEKEAEAPIQDGVNSSPRLKPKAQDVPVHDTNASSVQRTRAQEPLDVPSLCGPWIDDNETAPVRKNQRASDLERIPLRIHSTHPPKAQYALPILNSNPEDRDVAGGLLKLKDEAAHSDQKYSHIPRTHRVSPTLPALQSPPQSIGSPDSSRNLPSIKALVEGSLNEPGRLSGSNQSPFPMLAALERQFIPASFSRGTSFTHLSPASSKDMSSLSPTPATSTSQNSHWAPQLNVEGSQSQSPCDTSSHFTGSPAAGYPTPIEPRKDESEVHLPLNKRIKASSPHNSGGFKCDYPGCTADPFQTQYLLNSHANVHSENRPYYCPVKDCPRGEGGKGFKRKNEMIRHGLVHDSPGYVCPFCSNQQRRYPRPDNLQRHVRAQHPDKDKDDPLLRHVLAKRSEGVARGRRRRT